MRSIHYIPGTVRHQASTKTALDLQEISAILEKPSGLLWVDLSERGKDYEAPLEQVFHLHPLAINDALIETHTPKVDDWGPYLYVVLNAVDISEGNDIHISTYRLDAFLTAKSLLTIHDGSLNAIERIWNAAQSDDQYLRFGSVYLLYRLADEFLNSFEPVVKRVALRLDSHKTQVFENANRGILQSLISLKGSIHQLQKSLEPQRAVLHNLANNDYRFIDQRSQFYFRDVEDHLERLYKENENLRELANDLLRICQTMMQRQTNLFLRGLIIIAALFLPLSCIVGFFSMNFFMPTQPIAMWVSIPVFVLLLLFVLAYPIVVIMLLRRMRWV